MEDFNQKHSATPLERDREQIVEELTFSFLTLRKFDYFNLDSFKDWEEFLEKTPVEYSYLIGKEYYQDVRNKVKQFQNNFKSLFNFEYQRDFCDECD